MAAPATFCKWQADKLVPEMHATARPSQDVRLPSQGLYRVGGRGREARRSIVLGCLFMHILEEKSDLNDEVASGLMTAEEQKQLTKVVATVANGPTGDGKKDRFPSKHRPAFAFSKAQAINCSLHRSGKYHVAHLHGRRRCHRQHRQLVRGGRAPAHAAAATLLRGDPAPDPRGRQVSEVLDWHEPRRPVPRRAAGGASRSATRAGAPGLLVPNHRRHRARCRPSVKVATLLLGRLLLDESSRDEQPPGSTRTTSRLRR